MPEDTEQAPAAGSRDVKQRDQAGPGLAPVPSIRYRWALLVGVDEYVDPTIPRLSACVNDVRELEEVLTGLGYTVVALHDQVAEESRVPTRDNVEAELERLCQAAGDADLLWFHFSGHGRRSGEAELLVTREIREPMLAERALSLKRVQARLERSAPRRLLLTLDACHGGAERSSGEPLFFLHAHDSSRGLAILGGSTARQLAQEAGRHGVFTAQLLDGLGGAADRGNKGYITVMDLHRHVHDGVLRWVVEKGGLIQEPTFTGELVGDFIVADRRNHARVPLPAPARGVLQASIRARDALNPDTLPRISRAVVSDKYLPAIRLGVRGEGRRLVAIVGGAGYGKSTLLGEIYDVLMKELPWVALVRCSDVVLGLAPGRDDLVAALGQAAGSKLPINEVLRALVRGLGGGVLLIDTVDLLVDERVAPVLARLLIELTEAGATIVLTCRDHEFAEYFGPRGNRLPEVSGAIEHFTVPLFTAKEVTAAAEAFAAQALEQENRGAAAAFARRIQELSADSRSLQAIVSNPLMLSMLCAVFARDGTVPADLTVSELYEEYWSRKIARTRLEGAYSLVADFKNLICLQMAEVLFRQSEERLREAVDRHDLELPQREEVPRALRDLVSEGVLQDLAHGQKRFFHQTLLEYAMARWLRTGKAAADRNRLLDELRREDTQRRRLHFWPVVRLLLAIAELNDYQAICRRLDLGHWPAFRAAALAAAVREEPDALRELVPMALSCGPLHERALLEAVESLPQSRVAVGTEIALKLLAHGSEGTAGGAVEQLGLRVPEEGGTLFRTVLDAIGERQSVDGRLALSGRLFKAILDAADAPRPDLLAALRERYAGLTSSNQVTVLQLHQRAGVAVDDQLAVLEVVRGAVTPEMRGDEEEAYATAPSVGDPIRRGLRWALWGLLCQALPNLIGPGQGRRYRTWSEALYDPLLPPGWDKSQAMAVGAHAAREAGLLDAILQEALIGEDARRERALQALVGATKEDGGRALVARIHRLDPGRLYRERASRLRGVFKALLSGPADEEARSALAGWVEAAAVGPAAPPPPSGSVPELISSALSQKRLEALKASAALVSAARAEDCAFGFDDLLPLARSQFTGVRENLMKSCLVLVRGPRPVPEVALDRVCAALARESADAVLRPLFRLVGEWLRRERRVPRASLGASFEIFQGLMDSGLLQAGTARELVVLWREAARQGAEHVLLGLRKPVHSLLHSFDLGRINNGEALILDLLRAMHGPDPRYVAGLAADIHGVPLPSGVAIVRAINLILGPQTALLDQILSHPNVSPALAAEVQRIRGA